MSTSKSRELEDRIPADMGKTIFNEIEEYSKHENFRKKVKEIFKDCTETVSFMDTVKEYASREIDEKIFRNGKAVIIWAFSIICAAIIGAVVSKYIH